METVGSALSDHLHLTACRAVEIRSLAGGTDLELFNALDGRGNYSRWRSPRRTCAAVAVADRVRRVGAGHVVAVVAAIQGEPVLVGGGSCDVAGQRDAHLQDR